MNCSHFDNKSTPNTSNILNPCMFHVVREYHKPFGLSEEEVYIRGRVESTVTLSTLFQLNIVIYK